MMRFQGLYMDPVGVFTSCRSRSQAVVIDEWDLRETHHHFVFVNMVKNIFVDLKCCSTP